jgi:hypothetical protein
LKKKKRKKMKKGKKHLGRAIQKKKAWNAETQGSAPP